jgi:hypothetical protein
MSLRILLKKKYQGARTNLRGVFDLTIFFVMQLVSKAEKDSVKKKEERKKSHSRKDVLYVYDKLTAWLSLSV